MSLYGRYELGAKAKNGGAMWNLGMCFENGHGVTIDVQRAATLYAEAAALGHPLAQ